MTRSRSYRLCDSDSNLASQSTTQAIDYCKACKAMSRPSEALLQRLYPMSNDLSGYSAQRNFDSGQPVTPAPGRVVECQAYRTVSRNGPAGFAPHTLGPQPCLLAYKVQPSCTILAINTKGNEMAGCAGRLMSAHILIHSHAPGKMCCTLLHLTSALFPLESSSSDPEI